jgi:hypothetical protein
MANAAYPTLITVAGPQRAAADGRISVRATNGKLKTRRMYTDDKSTFDLEHYMTKTERDNYVTFYGNNKDLDIDFTDLSDRVTRVVRFAGPPQEEWLPGGMWRVRVKMEEA